MSSVNWTLRSLLLIMLVGFLITCAQVGHAARAGAASAQVPDATDLLKRSDAYRNGWPSFVTHVNWEALARHPDPWVQRVAAERRKRLHGA